MMVGILISFDFRPELFIVYTENVSGPVSVTARLRLIVSLLLDDSNLDDIDVELSRQAPRIAWSRYEDVSAPDNVRAIVKGLPSVN